MKYSLIILILLSCGANCTDFEYDVNDNNGVDRVFDGIGGLSGGGPNFGASLQILKVEIGGDDQSTDGTEASHMHEENEENYNRGYEWWLMKEAKARNPNIKLYGLPWAFPHWISPTLDQRQPYADVNKTANYIINWILGAKSVHNLTIDYIGIWNERPCDTQYILTLRSLLDENNLQNVQIIACDGGWPNFINNQTILNSVYALGAHYPGTTSGTDLIALNKRLWSSEDYSTYNNDVGAGCWARILNQNYVNGYMTSTISWNLIASYYFGLPYQECGLMTAAQPWSGNYDVKNTIWTSAHTTQFTEIGWNYLAHNYGVGLLSSGGSYVTLVSPDKKDLTLIIETMSNITVLHVFKTQLNFDGTESVAFLKVDDVKIVDNEFTITLGVDCIYTLTTLNNGVKGNFDNIPDPGVFPLPYFDDFQKSDEYSEPDNFVPQAGSWEILVDTDGSKFARQTVLTNPVAWCEVLPRPIAVIGDNTWRDIIISVDVRFPSANNSDSVFLAAQLPQAATGCQYNTNFNALFVWLNLTSSMITFTKDILAITSILKQENIGFTLQTDVWYNFRLTVQEYTMSATINGNNTFTLTLSDDGLQNGFAAIGSGTYGYTDIKNLYLSSPFIPPTIPTTTPIATTPSSANALFKTSEIICFLFALLVTTIFC